MSYWSHRSHSYLLRLPFIPRRLCGPRGLQHFTLRPDGEGAVHGPVPAAAALDELLLRQGEARADLEDDRWPARGIAGDVRAGSFEPARPELRHALPRGHD